MPGPRPFRLLPTTAVLALALTLSACSTGSSGSSAGSVPHSAPSAAADAYAPVEGAKVVDAASSATAPMLIKQAQVDLTVADVAEAAAQLRAIAAARGGSVTNESLVQSDGSGAPSSMTLSVPADTLDATIDEVAGVGTVVSRSASSTDVTSQYVDTQARIESMQRSVDRLRTLVDQATTVTDIAAIEAELTQRESDLDALKAQVKALEGQVTQSTILVSMSTRPEVFEDRSGGFVSGLSAGWRALLTSVGWLLTVIGALLPFALASAVVLVPLVLVLRARRRARAADAPPPAAPPAPVAPAPAAPGPGPGQRP